MADFGGGWERGPRGRGGGAGWGGWLGGGWLEGWGVAGSMELSGRGGLRRRSAFLYGGRE